MHVLCAVFAAVAMAVSVTVTLHHKTVDLVPRGSKMVKRIRFSLSFNVSSASDISLLDLLLSLDTQLSRIFDGIFQLENVAANDLVGIRIEFEGDAQPFFRMARFSNNPVQHFFDAISRLLQSNRKLLLSLWSVEMFIIPCPQGQGRQRKYPWSYEAAAKKQCVIRIESNDNMCLWRAVVVAYQHAQSRLVVERKHVSADVAKKRFRQVARQGSRIQTKVMSCQPEFTYTLSQQRWLRSIICYV